MKMQVYLPQLAEKILTFCSGHDVLQSLLRTLDRPDIAGTESVHIQRESLYDKSADDKLQQGTILRKLKGGLCFSLPVKTSEKISPILESQLRLSFRSSSGIVDSLPATVVGIMRFVAKPTKSIAFVRFTQPLVNAQYLCENIEFPISM